MSNDSVPREKCYDPVTLAMVDSCIATVVPRITSRTALVVAMCDVLRRANRCSECEFCDGIECASMRAHAAADLALAYMARVAAERG